MTTIILVSFLIACIPSTIIWWLWKRYVYRVIIIPNILRALENAWAKASCNLKATRFAIKGNRAAIEALSKALSAFPSGGVAYGPTILKSQERGGGEFITPINDLKPHHERIKSILDSKKTEPPPDSQDGPKDPINQ